MLSSASMNKLAVRIGILMPLNRLSHHSVFLSVKMWLSTWLSCRYKMMGRYFSRNAAILYILESHKSIFSVILKICDRINSYNAYSSLLSALSVSSFPMAIDSWAMDSSCFLEKFSVTRMFSSIVSTFIYSASMRFNPFRKVAVHSVVAWTDFRVKLATFSSVNFWNFSTPRSSTW